MRADTNIGAAAALFKPLQSSEIRAQRLGNPVGERRGRSGRPEVICPTMQVSSELVLHWLAGVAPCKLDTAMCWSALPDRVFSKFVKEWTPTAAAAGSRTSDHTQRKTVQRMIIRSEIR